MFDHLYDLVGAPRPTTCLVELDIMMLIDGRNELLLICIVSAPLGLLGSLWHQAGGRNSGNGSAL